MTEKLETIAVAGNAHPDIEKGSPHTSESIAQAAPETYSGISNKLKRWNDAIERLSGFEARGIQRVPEHERHPSSAMGHLQMLLLWFSANLTVNNLAVALTGPLVFQLGFADSVWCAIIGVFLGSVSTAYMSIWGAASGNRTMVCS